MEKLSVSKSKIPIVRQTKSSILLCNHNNLNNMNNYSFNNSADVRNSSPKLSEDENSEIKVRKRWKSVVNSLCQSQGPMLQTLCCRNCPGPVPQNVSHRIMVIWPLFPECSQFIWKLAVNVWPKLKLLKLWIRKDFWNGPISVYNGTFR